MVLDRSRVPPDVARRLAALASHRAPDRARPVTSRAPADAAAGAPPRSTTRTDHRPVRPAGWTPPVPGTPTAAENPSPDGADVPPAVGAAVAGGATCAPAPGTAPGTAWRPDVVAALADAAAAAPPVPAPPPRVRWAPSWRAAGAAVLVLALVAGGIVLRAAAVPRGEPVAIPTPAVDAAEGAGGEPVDEVVVVHVVGAVATPGVVRLPLGARVADAVAAAGGGTPDAELGAVNLARVLTDGEQLVVPVVGAGAPLEASAPTDGLVDLNDATAQELEELPGVGPVLAGRIVQRRTERPFTTVDELDDVPGIGPALLADLRPRVRV